MRTNDKELFETPEIEVVLIEADVVTASGFDGEEIELPRIPM